jgi:alkanesulfonate monooxygenase SsuD/methylene tetrahydromethanopterin reductase-like flavin-dependent oxidoreductase (luciferase family)
MVDVISNGRLEFGIGKGSESMEYIRAGVSQEEAAVRMKEGIEVLRQAWSDQPINFRGELFKYEDVNVLPKPVQRPHPRIWVGAAKSDDSFRWAGENGFDLMTLPYMYPTNATLQRFVALYRESLARAGRNVAENEILGKFHIYVSNSLEQAILREATPYLDNYTAVHAAGDPHRKPGGGLSRLDPASQMEQGFVIAGDPQRCIDAIHRWQHEIGLTTLSGTFYFGGMPQELALKNIRLFAEQVMPFCEGTPTWKP